MSQRSSDVPMLANFTIYIFPWDLLWTGWYHLKYIFSIDNNANQKSETFNKSQLSEFFDVPSRWTFSVSGSRFRTWKIYEIPAIAFGRLPFSWLVLTLCGVREEVMKHAPSPRTPWIRYWLIWWMSQPVSPSHEMNCLGFRNDWNKPRFFPRLIGQK